MGSVKTMYLVVFCGCSKKKKKCVVYFIVKADFFFSPSVLTHGWKSLQKVQGRGPLKLSFVFIEDNDSSCLHVSPTLTKYGPGPIQILPSFLVCDGVIYRFGTQFKFFVIFFIR